MGKRNQPPAESALAFGVGKLTRHLFVCIGPDCVDPDDGERTWEYVKKRMKELDITGKDGPFYRTKCKCLRICSGGPIAVVYPEGAWYRERHTEERGADHPGTPDRGGNRRGPLLRAQSPARARPLLRGRPQTVSTPPPAGLNIPPDGDVCMCVEARSPYMDC